MNSSHKSTGQILGTIPAVRAQRLLVDWANLNPFVSDVGAKKRLLRSYPEVFLGVNPEIYDERFRPLNTGTPANLRQRQQLVVSMNSLIATIAVLLREGWSVSDPRIREWCFIRARLAYHIELEGIRGAVQELRIGPQDIRETTDGVVRAKAFIPPVRVDDPKKEMRFSFLISLLALREVPLTPFEAAMFHLQTGLNHRIRRCPNPTCPAPYFFATKKGQRFCSTVCAEPAQREAKRRWWNENRGDSMDRLSNGSGSWPL